MNVWLVTDVYPPGCGGSGWSTHALARALTDAGHEILVVAVDPGSRHTSQRTFENVRIFEVGVAAARSSPVRRLGARDYAHRTLAEWLIERIAEEPEVEVLHGQHLHSGPPTVEAARATGRAAVVTLRDYWPVCLHGTSWWGGRECPGCLEGVAPEGTTGRLVGCMGEVWGWPAAFARTMVPWARRRLEARRQGLARAHGIIAVSEAVRRRVEPELGQVPIDVVPNIVDEERAQAEADVGLEALGGPEALQELGLAPNRYLIAAGKLTPTKGFGVLLEWLAAAGSPFPLVIAGSGPERERLEELARRGGLDVRFTGWIDHDRLLALVRAARAMVIPSVWQEPLSRLLLESMALGTPVVAWATGGSPEAIEDGRDGWLVGERGDLVRVMGEVGRDEVVEGVGERARVAARERFGPGAVVSRLVELYRRAVERAGEGRAGLSVLGVSRGERRSAGATGA